MLRIQIRFLEVWGLLLLSWYNAAWSFWSRTRKHHFVVVPVLPGGPVATVAQLDIDRKCLGNRWCNWHPQCNYVILVQPRKYVIISGDTLVFAQNSLNHRILGKILVCHLPTAIKFHLEVMLRAPDPPLNCKSLLPSCLASWQSYIETSRFL